MTPYRVERIPNPLHMARCVAAIRERWRRESGFCVEERVTARRERG